MGLFDLNITLQTKNGSDHSLEDQSTLARVLHQHDIKRGIASLERKEISALLSKRGIQLEYNLDTVLDNLHEAGLVDKFFEPGTDHWSISERQGVINGRVEEAYREEAARLMAQVHESDSNEEPLLMDGGENVSLRHFLAEALDVSPDELEKAFQEGDLWRDRISNLNDAIDAIERSDEFSRRSSYGRIIYRNKPYQYCLSKKAQRLLSQ